jgi:hypothetical protein
MQRLRQRWKMCVDNEGDFVKDVPMIYIHFIVIVIIAYEKRGGITFIPPIVRQAMYV